MYLRPGGTGEILRGGGSAGWNENRGSAETRCGSGRDPEEEGSGTGSEVQDGDSGMNFGVKGEVLSRRLCLAVGISTGVLLPCPLRTQTTAATTAPENPGKAAVVYTNRQYGFRFNLPADWKGYSVLVQRWDGTTQEEPRRKEHGPRIVLRDPRWTKAKPRQDIPIMILTLAQWKQDLVVSAAPIGPSELGRNPRYVFALPPRYNFAFEDGYQEVEEIMKTKPLHPF